VLYSNIIEGMEIENFCNRLKKQKIIDITRRGKWLVFELNDYYLLSHLRMEGKYFLKKSSDIITKHEHVVFEFDDDSELRYQDTRKFGRMYLLDKDKLNELKIIKELGLEPWDKKLDSDYLKSKYSKKKLPIKTVVLDQSIITGIGNIYADEILFMSKLSPLKQSSLLTKEELDLIIINTRIVLEKAIKEGGTTIRSYTSEEGITGRFQNSLLVHCREGESCYVCGSKIKKIKVGGRGTYYCSICQK